MQYFIVRAIDNSHSSFPDFRYNVIVAEHLTDQSQLLGNNMLGSGPKLRQRRWDSFASSRCPHFSDIRGSQTVVRPSPPKRRHARKCRAAPLLTSTLLTSVSGERSRRPSPFE